MTDFEKGTLIMLCVVIIAIIAILIIFLIVSRKKETDAKKPGANAIHMTKLGMPYDDIKNFLPFDDIKDNMIIQEKGERYTMLVECEGINYYLMSEAEKISVEEGFIQFLNSLRFPVQIYVQTRTVNLDESLKAYYERLNKLQTEFDRLLDTFQLLDKQGASEEKLLEIGFALEKKEKVLEYTRDLIDNISYLTQNTNVLQKKYYIVVSYHVTELGLVNNIAPDEMHEVAYNELSNRANSIRGAISSCGIETHILDTEELTEVMYIAVNRDDADIFNIKKIMDSDISSLSTTAKDPMKKKQELLKEERIAKEKQKELEKNMMLEQARMEAKHSSSGVDASTLL